MQYSEVYIHKCYENELGYRAGVPKKAGRFIFISKTVAKFFPHLSEIELNDNVLINIVDLNNSIVLCNYVYHNSKTATANERETRNEYRLYIPNEIDTNRDLFKPNDIIIFAKYKIENEIYFKINLFQFADYNDNYKYLNSLLEEAKTSLKNVNHLLVNLDLVDFLNVELKIDNKEKIIPSETIDKMIENQKHLFENLEETSKKDKEVPSDETGLVKSNNFRDIVLFAYMGKCAITGKSINYQALSNLEAAHVMPQSHNGPDAVPNGIALSRDLHWAFDKGFFTICSSDNKYIVCVHENVKNNEVMKKIDGLEIFKPSDLRFILHKNALTYHQKHIFGTFKQIRART